MASPQPEISVVLPAYREEENLRLLLPRLLKSLAGLGASSEVLVVDTMESMDLTAEVCAEHGVRHLNRQGGNYYGDAVRTGLHQARGAYILFMDADGSHTPEFIPHLWSERGPERVVIASRYVAGGDTENPKSLIAMSHVVNFVYSLVLGIRCKDVSNSFKLYPAEVVRSLNLRCSNFDIVEELLVKAARTRRDLALIEVPYVFKKRMFGQTKRNLFIFMLTYIYSLLHLRFGK